MLVREERLAGYRLALEEAGISLDPSLVIETSTNYSGGGAAVPRLLNLPEPATAALCFNDVVAIGLTRALMEAGVSVGVDFDVIGFDDIEEAKHTRPALSSVAVNRPRSRFARSPTAHAPSRERRLRAGSRALPDHLGASQVLPGRGP